MVLTIPIKTELLSLFSPQTYSAISKNEQSGSRESLPSGFPSGPGDSHPLGDLEDNGSSGHRRTFSDQVFYHVMKEKVG